MCQNLLKGINKSASVTKAKVQKIVKTSHDVKMDKNHQSLCESDTVPNWVCHTPNE